MKKILFITHETTRTGAPIVLLHFLQWLQKHHKELVVDVIGLQGGSLESDFKNACHTYYDYCQVLIPKSLTRWQRILLKFKLFKRQDPKVLFFNTLAENNYALLYANTILTIPLASEVIKVSPKTKFVAHIHELNAIIKIMLPNFKDYLSGINQFIVPSELVESNLTANWSVPANGIKVVYECTVVEYIKPTNKPCNVFTVGASGYVHWRKGHDVFLQLARYIHSNYPDSNINFVWVGKLPLKEQIILEADIHKLGLKDIVKFTGEVKNPTNYYNEFNVFVMTSREDPFPLVCIEVGMLGKPIVSFDRAVGTNEILNGAGGFIVPYLNIEAMADKIIKYYNNPDLVKSHGELNEKVFSQFTPEIICPQLFEIITSLNKA
ncbi:glycosyltransferase [Confluentibacter citreus]|uniref:glycosyltransferase n=1 Tax=Confluentibacter citreus TaxID=2007307 RepID=UPI000C293DB5|nr:glycosyltransferase [Confluentibacter citreus]